MPSKPLVTIVTPSFNRKAFLKTCVNSIQCQSYGAIEHIVVDGGSTDGTVELLDEMQRAGMLRYISEPDGGMYDAINKGLQLARGAFIAYLNTDDRYFPWTIDTAVRALDRHQADLVYGDLCVVVRQNQRDRWYLQFYSDFNPRYYTYFATIAQPTVFMRRALVDRIGGFGNGFKLIADCDYWLRCHEAGARIEHVNEVLAIQIDHAETLRETRVQELHLEFARLYLQHGSSLGAPPSSWRKRLVNTTRARYAKLRYIACVLGRRCGDENRWGAFSAWLDVPERSPMRTLMETTTQLLPGFMASRGDSVVGGALVPSRLRQMLL